MTDLLRSLLALAVYFAVHVAIFVLVPEGIRAVRHAVLRRNGVAAQAQIASAFFSGLQVDRLPEWVVVLDVVPVGREPFHVEVRQILPKPHGRLLKEGRWVTIKFDPASPARAVITAFADEQAES